MKSSYTSAPITSNLTVLHDDTEWTTQFDGNIHGVKIDGSEIMQIHDLAKNVDRQNKQIRILALIATTMALFVLVIVSSVGYWLLKNEGRINQSLTDTSDIRLENERLQSSNQVMGMKLVDLGWVWKDNGWQRIGNTAPILSK